MKRPRHHRRPKKPIETMALEYLTTRRSFARNRMLKRMYVGFGIKKTARAIDQMASTLTICDPNFVRR